MTRPSPSPVTDDGLVERCARAIFDDHNRVYSVSQCKWESDPNHWRRYARAALAASDRDVLVGVLVKLRKLAMDDHWGTPKVCWEIIQTIDAALPLAGEL